MKEFLAHYKIHIVIGGFFVLVLPLLVWVVNRQLELVQSDVATIQKGTLDQEVTQKLLQRIPEFREQRTDIEEHIGDVEVLLENTDDAKIALYDEIEQMAGDTKHSQIALNVTKYKKPQAPKAVTDGEDTAPAPVPLVQPAAAQFLYLHVRTVGTFNDALDFMHKLENIRYFSDILSFDMHTYTEAAPAPAAEGEEENTRADGRPNLIESDIYIAFYFDTEVMAAIDSAQDVTPAPAPSSNDTQTVDVIVVNPDIDPDVTALEGDHYLPMQDSEGTK